MWYSRELTHFHLLCIQKRTLLKQHLNLKTLLLRYRKIQFIFTQKNLLTFSMNVWLKEGFTIHWIEQVILWFLKKGTIRKRKTISQWVCSLPFWKCLKNYYLNKLMIIYKLNSQSIMMVFAKTTALKIIYCLRLKNWKLFWIKSSKWVLFSKTFDTFF